MNIPCVRRCRPLLGTFVEVTLAGDADTAMLHAWAGDAFAAVERVHRLMSFQDSHSELSCLNATAHVRPQPVHAWTRDVLCFAKKMGNDSRGAFDIAYRSERGGSYRDIILSDDGTVSFRRRLSVDLGGIAKGFAVDQAIVALARQPISHACVNAGGDLRVWGRAPDHVDIRDPARPRDRVHRVALTHPAAATSASYFRSEDDEIRCPKQGRPVTTTSSVTVFAQTCMVADALTKVVMLADPELVARVLVAHDAASFMLNPLPA